MDSVRNLSPLMFISIICTTVELILCTYIYHVIPTYIRPSAHFFTSYSSCNPYLFDMYISTNVPLNLNKTFLSLGISACKYNHGTSKVATFSPSYASITRGMNKSSSNTIGDATLSPYFKYLFLLGTISVSSSLDDTIDFSFVRFTDSSACLAFHL